ncbi:hypothetical protein [Bremerella alba]|uniref:Uncharacterized protein n=1 Tax=Bremerella alba TaxID=980252 RepID=A0A7V8V607_9BACT|nr:hypothetical protein [Bremerella alba]MBA2115485.1 hypothetical protein [Bremerella alba]
MLDADSFVGLLKAAVIATVVIELAQLFCLIGLMNRMFDHGDHAWGWVTAVVAFVPIVDSWLGSLLPGLKLILEVCAFVGMIAVLIVGWIRHRKYDVTKRMILLSVLLLARIGVWVGVIMLFRLSLPPMPTATP